MTLYLDTSVLVATLSNEAVSSRVRAWLRQSDPALLAVSGWTITEVSSALARKVRTGEFDHAQRLEALANFRRLMSTYQVAEIIRSDFDRAAAFADRPGSTLRSGDALHLAVAIRSGWGLRTLDHSLAGEGAALGHDVSLVAVQ